MHEIQQEELLDAGSFLQTLKSPVTQDKVDVS